jgi:hypothetical protein
MLLEFTSVNIVFYYYFRFGSQHLTPSGRNIINSSLYEKFLQTKSTINQLDKSVQFSLRKHLYDFSKSDSVITKYDGKCKGKTNCGNSKECVEQNENSKEQGEEKFCVKVNTLCEAETSANVDLICEAECENDNGSENCTCGDGVRSSDTISTCGAVTDEDVIQVRKEERKKVKETVTSIYS